jgi:DNA gyrase subunit A
MATRDEDVVEFLFAARTLDTILYFTNRGKVYSEKAYQVPDGSRTGKGVPIVNLINIAPGEKITATVVVPDFDQAEYLIMLTRKGRIKRTDLSEFESVRPSGLIALTLDHDDELGWVELTNGRNEIIVVSRSGQAVRFDETDVRSMGRTAAGVGAMRLRRNDEMKGLDVVDPEASLLIVTENGFAKRTHLSEYNLQRRNGSGVRTLTKDMQKTGQVVAAKVVSNQGDITLISREGIMLRTALKNIPLLGRATRGVRVMGLRNQDEVASVAILVPKGKDFPEAGQDDYPAVEDDKQELVTSAGLSNIPTNGHQEQ